MTPPRRSTAPLAAATPPLPLMASILLAAFLAGAAPARAQVPALLETGSSLLYPLFNLWVAAYTKTHRVQITTQSTGSGAGIAEAVSGLAQIGASDAYLSDAMMRLHPDVLNIPLAIASQMVNYNVPGLNQDHLKLSGPVLAAIYQGRITTWNDPAIARLNPGVALPDHAVIPLHRTDGSGDTFVFTRFLSDTTPSWAGTLAYGPSISWPAVPSAIGAEGNQGMVGALRQNPYSIAYVGISYKAAIDQDRLGEAALRGRDGSFLLPEEGTIRAAAAAMGGKIPRNEAVSLVFQPGARSYPLVNYEYAIVNTRLPPAAADALRGFLSWVLQPDGGSAGTYLKQVGFVALPDSVRRLSEDRIGRIGAQRGASR